MTWARLIRAARTRARRVLLPYLLSPRPSRPVSPLVKKESYIVTWWYYFRSQPLVTTISSVPS